MKRVPPKIRDRYYPCNKKCNKKKMNLNLSHLIKVYHLRLTLQALVYQLRTIWYNIGSFDVEKIQEFLNPQPAFAV